MQKRPSSRTTGHARVEGVLRYKNENEGALCSGRCRELSRTGLTAAIERPVFPGDLLRFDLEPAGGGRSVTGLARVAWTGSDPEGAPGTSVMRIRFLSLGDTSEQALLEWLDELSDVTDRPSSPRDDSSVRALDRAIADALLPPPPVLPGAKARSEASSNGVTPAPVAVPNRPSIPPPPGLYMRGSRDLTHPVEHVGEVATRIAPPMPPPSKSPPKRAPVPPLSAPRTNAGELFPQSPPSLFAPDAPTPAVAAMNLEPPESHEMPPSRVSAPPLDEAADAPVEPLAGTRSKPPLPSDAPWSMPARPVQGGPGRPWLALCLASVAAGAALAYLVYGRSAFSRGAPEPVVAPHAAAVRPAAAAPGALLSPAPSAATDRMARPAALLSAAPEQPAAPAKAPGSLSPPAPPLVSAAAREVAAAPGLVPASMPGDKLLPPAPEVPNAVGGAPAASDRRGASRAATDRRGASRAGTAGAPGSRLDRARACLAQGDLACATELLRNAKTEAELELWIETLRAQGKGLAARRAMNRFVAAYPDGRRAAIYRRILSNAP